MSGGVEDQCKGRRQKAPQWSTGVRIFRPAGSRGNELANALGDIERIEGGDEKGFLD